MLKKQHNELKHNIESNTKKFIRAERVLEQVRLKYDTTEVREKTSTAVERIEGIQKKTMNEKHVADSLKHQLSSYKSDILKIKMGAERWKDIMKKLTLEK